MTKIELETVVGTVLDKCIFHVELNRPKALNAMSRQFFADMQSLFMRMEQLRKQHDIRVVVVTGRGRHFSAGLDLKEAAAMFSEQRNELDPARKAVQLYDLIKDWQRSMNVLNECQVPVVVGIQGYCLGGGVDLVSAADIRYCTKDSRFSIKEVDIGMAADIGTLQRIVLVANNQSLVRELAYTGRYFDGVEAKALGLVSRVCEDEEQMVREVFALAEEIASKSPIAIYTNKAVFRREFNKRVDDNLDSMARINSAMLQTNDVMEAVQASLMRQKGQYPKL